MAKPETHAAIKAKFPKLNLTKKRLDLIGDKLEPKVTTELTLDALIDSFNEFQPIEDLAKLDDKVVTAEQKLKEAKNPPRKEDEPITEPVVTDDMPAWAKPLFEQNKKLSESLASMQKDKTMGSIKQKATEALKEVPASYWGKRAIPEKDEELEAFITEVKTDYGAFTKELTDQGLKVLPVPRSGGAPSDGSKAVSAEVKSYMDKQKTVQAAAGPANNAAPGGPAKFINTPQPL